MVRDTLQNLIDRKRGAVLTAAQLAQLRSAVIAAYPKTLGHLAGAESVAARAADDFEKIFGS